MEVISTVLSVFLLLFIGYGAKKVRLLRLEDADLLNTVVIYITLPAFVFEILYGYQQSLPLSIAKVPALGFLATLVVVAAAYGIGRALKLDRRTLAGLMIAGGFGNTGFMGYPVVQAAFSDRQALVTAVLYDELAMALPLFTVGVLIAGGWRGRANVQQFLWFLSLPALWAIPVALSLRSVELPASLLRAIGYLGSGTIPLVMISTGLSLSARSLKGLAAPVLAACLLKLALLPILTCCALQASGVTGVTHQTAVLEAGMPTAVMSGVIASKFGANGRFVAGVIFVSTLLSILTIPTVLLLLGVS